MHHIKSEKYKDLLALLWCACNGDIISLAETYIIVEPSIEITEETPDGVIGSMVSLCNDYLTCDYERHMFCEYLDEKINHKGKLMHIQDKVGGNMKQYIGLPNTKHSLENMKNQLYKYIEAMFPGDRFELTFDKSSNNQSIVDIKINFTPNPPEIFLEIQK